ncbi:MAG TPA: UDP-N-acetyl-D-mannosamine dehydrogenase [Xanthobacteraceae bacterium]|nr:UDP-N-acetyl-D-mannosamine dehydrogenase [Xanthobacteraceae bacterium]
MQTGIQTVSVIGLGYVGLPTAATFAARGLDVIGVDVNRDAVERINSGRAHIVEPDLDMVLGAAVKSGKLRAVTAPEAADAFIIAVPTPIAADHKADLAAVEVALKSIAPVLTRGNLIVIESTSPVGTTERAAELLRKLRPDLTLPTANPEHSDILLAYCPERILPGQTLRELIDNARIIGGLDRRSAARAKELYSCFATGPIKTTTARVAELSKLVENAYRDVNVAFANELSLVCDALGIDVWSVIRMANLHPRVNILSPGPGVGGHCIPVDPWFIHQALPEQTPLIKTAREVNDGKPHFVADRIVKLAKRFRQPVIGLLGLSYKPNVDDLRDSPALEIACKVASRRVGTVLAVEPHLRELPPPLANFPGVQLTDLPTAVRRADIVGILVAHNKFRSLDRGTVASKIVVDTVGLLAGLDEAA